MELRQYLTLFRKWAWLIVLVTAIAGGSAYYYSRTIPPTYRAETTVLVGQLQQNASPNPTDLYAASNLAQAYTLLVTQPPILEATANAVHWPESWQTLYFHVSATSPSSQLLDIAVTTGDPDQAKTIANELTHQLILQSPVSQQQKQAEDQRQFVASQQAVLKSQIENGQKNLADLTDRAALETDPNKLSDLNTRISALQSKIDTWQKNYVDLSNLLSTGPNNFLTVLASAQTPTTPFSPNIRQNVLFASLAGLILAAATILLLEYLDDRIKSADDAQRVLKLGTLGVITRIAGIHTPTDHLITVKHPRSPVAEAYRVLRTNLRFSGIENPSGALLVTSAGPGEGKTTTAGNLAVAMAQSGRKVVLVDTDLRRPFVHNLFGLSNDAGLSNLFLDDAATIDAVMQPTSVEGLRVITSGHLPPNPAEVLDSKRMTEVIEALRARSDMVIFDSPPVLAVADASILGSRCSGAILVVDTGRSRTEAVRRGADTLRQTNVKLLGVVLNKLSTGHSLGYSHYYYYYSQDHKSKPNGNKPRPDERKQPFGKMPTSTK
jgi:tyrosine-protein kinase